MTTPDDTPPCAPADDERRCWAAVARAPCLHVDHLRPALAQAGSVLALWRERVEQLRALGLPPAASALFAEPPEALLDADLAFAARSGTRLLPYTDADYPAQLLQVPAAPAALYVRGDVAVLHRPQLAMVGSRHPTGAGRDIARGFAQAFAAAGVVVVSGLARGIDAASHAGALDGGGLTVAVCGTGLDRVYPAAPRRNRILAGLARGTLDVEAAPRSGSLITARCALDQGREVFAIPGSIRSLQSAGCHELLRDGARLVTTAAHVLAEVGLPIENLSFQNQLFTDPPGPVGRPSRLDKASEMLLDALGFEPASIDELVDRTGLSPGSIASMLLILELDLRIEPQPGGRYCRVR